MITFNFQQIGSFKLKQHHTFIKQWGATQAHLNFELIWMAGEKCIHQLSPLKQ